MLQRKKRVGTELRAAVYYLDIGFQKRNPRPENIRDFREEGLECLPASHAGRPLLGRFPLT